MISKVEHSIPDATNLAFLGLKEYDRSARVSQKLNFNPLALLRLELVIESEASLFLVEGVDDYAHEQVEE